MKITPGGNDGVESWQSHTRLNLQLEAVLHDQWCVADIND